MSEVLRSVAGDRLSSGIRELDEILGGGFPTNSINIIMGHPGTGKTILAEQLAFHNATGDRPILYLTTLSEPLSKVIKYLQGFSFYDGEKLFGAVVYEDISEGIAHGGVAFLVERLRQAIRDIGPKLVIIDSFKVVHDLSPSIADLRRSISELAGVLSAYETTAFLVGEYSEEHIPAYPEFGIADGIVQFSRRGSSTRDERYLRVLKLRGSNYAEGLHAFRISRDGLHVYPRLVTPSIPDTYEAANDRVTTGVDGLDLLLGGGFWRGSTTLVTGRAGTGKTTIGLQFAIEGVARGERSLYINFQENPTQLARTIAALGVDVDELRQQGLFLHYESPVELRIDSIVVELFRRIREEKIGRVVIDAVGDLELAADGNDRFHDYMYSLCQHMIAVGTTTLMTMEVTPVVRDESLRHETRFSSMSDTLIDLGIEMNGSPRRTLRVVKARGIQHDLRVHEMEITSGGVQVKEPLHW